MTIEIVGLKKSYGGTLAIADSTFTVKDGEMLVLLGPSGCGKTTTMRCVAGLEQPDEGRISIDGRPVFDAEAGLNVPASRRQVGMVFQSYAIWPHMTVAENVGFPLEMANVPKDARRDRVQAMLKIVGLEKFGDRGASYLSGGQMQRVALARSLVMEPKVLLFDEPLSNLDARLRDSLRVHLREIQTRMNITAIYVTHDQREALALADEIIVMEAGVIEQRGDPVTIYSKPRTSEIADFLGYSNIFPLDEVKSDDDGACGRLAASGHRLHSAASYTGTGEMAACVRPDHVRICANDGQASGRNVLNGEIMLASYMGSQMQYVVRTADDELWEVLTSEISRELRPKSSVRLEISPHDVQFLSAGKSLA